MVLGTASPDCHHRQARAGIGTVTHNNYEVHHTWPWHTARDVWNADIAIAALISVLSMVDRSCPGSPKSFFVSPRSELELLNFSLVYAVLCLPTLCLLSCQTGEKSKKAPKVKAPDINDQEFPGLPGMAAKPKSEEAGEGEDGEDANGDGDGEGAGDAADGDDKTEKVRFAAEAGGLVALLARSPVCCCDTVADNLCCADSSVSVTRWRAFGWQ